MGRILVQVKFSDEEESYYDLEIPNDELVETVAGWMAEAIDRAEETASYNLRIYPARKDLDPKLTLAQQGVWSGANLRIMPTNNKASTPKTKSQPQNSTETGSKGSSSAPSTPTTKFQSESTGAFLQSASGKNYSLLSKEVILGRQTPDQPQVSNLIDLSAEANSGSVSRQHARIQFIDDQWRLYPLPETKNSTRIDGMAIPADSYAILKQGDQIQVAQVTLTFSVQPEKEISGAAS